MYFQALYELLIVGPCCALTVPNTLYGMLHFEEVLDVSGRHLRRVAYLLGLCIALVVRLGPCGMMVLLRLGLHRGLIVL